MPGVNIKKDDQVMVMSGKDRGHVGRVVNVLPREGRVMVEGAARAKKHARQRKDSSTRQGFIEAGIMDIELFFDISNVQIVCKSCGQPTRVGHRMEGDGKVRICRKCEGEL